MPKTRNQRDLPIRDGSIKTEMLADGSVTIKKLADGIITESKLMAASVTSNKIHDGSINPSHFSELFPVVGTTSQIIVTGGSDSVIGGTVTISAPQDIDTAARPTFAGLTINGNVSVTGGIKAGDSASTPATGTILSKQTAFNRGIYYFNTTTDSWIIAGAALNEFQFNAGGTAHFYVTNAGDVIAGNRTALATNATNGFFYMPVSAGTPTGIPASYAGKVASEYDTSNDLMKIYNGNWKSFVPKKGNADFSGIIFSHVGKTSDYVLLENDYTVTCDGTLSVTLPLGITGTLYNVKNNGNGKVTVLPSGAQTIEGETQQFLYQGNCMTVQSTGAAWIII